MDGFDEQRANYEETQRIVNDYFDKNNLDDWGNPKLPKVVKKSPQQQIAERNQAYQQKRVNASPLASGLSNMNGSDWADVGGQALQGAERIADGATFGGYAWLDRTHGGNYDERNKQRLQEQADSVGIGGLNSVTVRV